MVASAKLLFLAGLIKSSVPMNSSLSNYIIKGVTAHGFGVVSDTQDDCMSTDLDFTLLEDVTNVGGGGGGPAAPSKGVNVVLREYNSCTNMMRLMYLKDLSPTSVIDFKTGASIQTSFTEGESCYGLFPFGESVCDIIPLQLVINATAVPIEKPEKFRVQRHYIMPDHVSKSRFLAFTAEATVDFSGTSLNGVPFVPDYSSGSLEKLIRGNMEIYWHH